MKYAATTRLLQTREEELSVHRTVEKTEGRSSQSKQATGKMGAKCRKIYQIGNALWKSSDRGWTVQR